MNTNLNEMALQKDLSLVFLMDVVFQINCLVQKQGLVRMDLWTRLLSSWNAHYQLVFLQLLL